MLVYTVLHIICRLPLYYKRVAYIQQVILREQRLFSPMNNREANGTYLN